MGCSPFQITRTVSAWSGEDYFDASVSYTATVYPITINLSGTTKDSNGADNILIGQGCTGSLDTDASVTLSNFQWSPGPVFDQFLVDPSNASANGDRSPTWGHVTYLSDSAYQSPNPHWHYYEDSGDDTFLVTCSATASVDGIAIGTIQGQRDVKVWSPYYTKSFWTVVV